MSEESFWAKSPAAVMLLTMEDERNVSHANRR